MGEDFFEEAEADDITDDIEGFDKNSPPVLPELAPYVEYWNLDEYAHEIMVSSDHSEFTVREVELNPQAIYQDGCITWDSKYSDKKNFNWSQDKLTEKPGTEKDFTIDRVVYRRELFMEDNKKGVQDPHPAIMLYDAQKGVFGHLYVVTNGEDFDPRKMAIGICENTMSDSIDEFFYDKQPLAVDNDALSTSGKGFHACVGYLHGWDVNWNREANLEEGWANLAEQDSVK